MGLRQPNGTRTSYKALSYTWGTATSPEDVETIRLDRKDVCVRQNLWDFLDTMRQQERHGPFWIDALCIDQLSVAEKEAQLKLMPQTYSLAEEVVVWLGKCEGKELSSALLELYIQCAGGRYRRGQHQSAARRQAFRHLVENKYWTRLWIVQEIFKARRIGVHIGTYRWTFSELVSMRRGLTPLHDSSFDWTSWDGIVEMKEQWKKNTRLDLHEVLFRWGHQNCQDPHDKVYGLLGLVYGPVMAVDLNISTLELFRQVLELEKPRIYARGYRYSQEFTTKLATNLGLWYVKGVYRVIAEFLVSYEADEMTKP